MCVIVQAVGEKRESKEGKMKTPYGGASAVRNTLFQSLPSIPRAPSIIASTILPSLSMTFRNQSVPYLNSSMIMPLAQMYLSSFRSSVRRYILFITNSYTQAILIWNFTISSSISGLSLNLAMVKRSRIQYFFYHRSPYMSLV